MDIPYVERVLVILAGLCFGSFATAASHRLPRNEEIVFTPSHCPACNHKLGVKDLFPVVSWLLSKGACRYCKVSVHWRYPLIELCTAAMFFFLYTQYGVTYQSLVLALLVVCMVIFFTTDFEHRIIPDEVQIAMLLLGVIYNFVIEKPFEDTVSGFAVGLGIGLTLRFGYSFLRNREGLGWGDVKFLAVVGVWIGIKPLVPFLFFSGVLGVATALAWRAMKKGEEFPFGPALGASMFLCIVFPTLANGFWEMGTWLQ
jgi:leader peptidase (prepilin peptidase)/N-methyltransferase